MSCAIADCGVPTCPVCTVSATFKIAVCGLDCKLVKGHAGPCQASTRKGKSARAELKS